VLAVEATGLQHERWSGVRTIQDHHG
jgi:hypothetical protein